MVRLQELFISGFGNSIDLPLLQQNGFSELSSFHISLRGEGFFRKILLKDVARFLEAG
jgi:hypothetical protein